jgi:cysteine synthase
MLGNEVWVKFEGINPTGSFKDRGMTMAISKAAEDGARRSSAHQQEIHLHQLLHMQLKLEWFLLFSSLKARLQWASSHRQLHMVQHFCRFKEISMIV